MDQKMPRFLKQNHTKAPRHLTQKGQPSDAYIAEMFLEKSIREFRIAQLKEEIDVSLSEKNKHEFLRLVKELERITINE